MIISMNYIWCSDQAWESTTRNELCNRFLGGEINLQVSSWIHIQICQFHGTVRAGQRQGPVKMFFDCEVLVHKQDMLYASEHG